MSQTSESSNDELPNSDVEAPVTEESGEKTESIAPVLEEEITDPKPCPHECVNKIDIEININLTAHLLTKLEINKPDVANTEFIYYNTTLREVAPKLTSDVDRQHVIPWLRKLYRPEYHSSRFRHKRNKYLLYLSLTLMNDEVYGIFRSMPPRGALLEFKEVPQLHAPDRRLAEWERDSMWKDVIKSSLKTHDRMDCGTHTLISQCKEDVRHGELMDEEFTFFLYLTRPFAVLLRNPEDRTRIAAWLHTLCTIQPNSCSIMKTIRNDYMQALLGYIHEMRIAGPFSSYPGWEPLIPLTEAAKNLAQRYPTVDPCNRDSNDFLSRQPVPDEGAYCFMAITGQLFNTSLDELD